MVQTSKLSKTQQLVLDRIKKENLFIKIIDPPAICGGLHAELKKGNITVKTINILTAKKVIQFLKLVSSEHKDFVKICIFK